MQIVGDPAAMSNVVAEAALFGQTALTARERLEFYARARTAFAVLQTTEQRGYGNFIIRKGVI